MKKVKSVVRKPRILDSTLYWHPRVLLVQKRRLVQPEAPLRPGAATRPTPVNDAVDPSRPLSPRWNAPGQDTLRRTSHIAARQFSAGSRARVARPTPQLALRRQSRVWVGPVTPYPGRETVGVAGHLINETAAQNDLTGMGGSCVLERCLV